MSARVPFLLLRFVFVLLWLAVAISLCAQGTAEIRGRVTIAGGLTGVEGATVTLDASPADGNPERSARTDPFGFYTLTAVTGGSYRFEVRHPAFISHQADIALSASERSQRLVALAPLGDFASRFDIVVRVADVTSGLVLGDVPVAALRFNAAGDASPAETSVASTDANGTVTFRGVLAGYYRFRINSGSDGAVKPKWESYTTEGTANDRKHLTQPHMLNMLLKPIPQDLTIEVRGFDPKAGPEGTANAPLAEVYVEATGVDPGNLNSVVVPVRVGNTDSEGNITFKGLPSIAWRIRAKKLGYEPTEIVVSRDSVFGLLPTDPVVVNLAFRQTALRAVLSSVYKNGSIVTNLAVKLTGLAGTGTEAIVRTNLSVWAGGLAQTASTTFSNLLPGRYEILVTGTNTSAALQSGGDFAPRTFTARFRGRGFGEAMLGASTNVPIFLNVEPAIIRGRFFVAESTTQAAQPQADGSKFFKGNAPLYALQPHTNITFRESRMFRYQANLLQFPVADVDHATAADGAGEFVLAIPPDGYGLVIPGLDGYVGDTVRRTDVAAGQTTREMWPYFYHLTDVTFPIATFEGVHGLGLVFDSGGEYRLDLFVRKQLYDVQGAIQVAAGGHVRDGTRLLTLLNGTSGGSIRRPYSDLVGEATATLTLPDNSMRNTPVVWGARSFETAVGSDYVARTEGVFEFKNLAPGSYSVTVSHPRYTIQTGGTTATVLNFALPTWGSPGIILPGDVSNTTFQPRESNWPMEQAIKLGNELPGAFDAVSSVPASNVRVVADALTYNFDDGQYTGTSYSNVPPHFVSPPYAPNVILANSSDVGFFPGTWTVYWDFTAQTGNSNASYSAVISGGTDNSERRFTIRLDGPSKDASLIPALRTGYSLMINTVSSEDPSMVVSNVNVTLEPGLTVTAPLSTNGFKGDYQPDAVTHPNWVWESVLDVGAPYRLEITNSEVNLTLFLKRGMGISGTVVNTNDVAVSNAPVSIRDVYGELLSRAITGADGSYQLAQALRTAKTVFVDVNAPGYVPSRVRVIADPNSGTPDITSSNRLATLPLPVITNAAVNRVGLFLPGISRAGNQGAYLETTAEQALTMTWTSRVQAVRLNYQLPDFNGLDGAPRPDRAFDYADHIAEVWFVDARSFATNTYASLPVDLALPNWQIPEEAHAWLRKVADGTFPNVFHQRVTNPKYDDPADQYVASGQVRLDRLPPGELKPWIVAVTGNGAINAKAITYPQAETQKRLRGVRLPASMSFFSDIISLIASTVGNNLEIEKAAPKGRFIPLPQFNSSITTNTDGFMDYSWSVGVKWEDGQVGPQSGILKLGAKKLGLAFDTGIKLEADGAADHFVLGRDASFGAPRASRFDYAPDDAKDSDGKVKKAKVDFLWNITAGVSESVEFNSQVYPNEQRVSTYANGYIGAAFEYKLFSTAFVVPPVGAILATFDVALDVNATASAIVGAAITNQWTTVFPRLEETGLGRSYQVGGTSEQPPRDTNVVHQLQRHFLGGRELSRSFGLSYNLNAGLEARLARIASVRGGLTLQGNESQLGGIGSPVPSVKVDVNPNGDFPYIKRMSGTFNAYLEADLNLYLARVGKRWNWPLYEFDYQYGTTPVFQLIPMGISQTLATPAGGTAVTFLGSGQTLLQNFFPGGSFHAASGAADALVFTDIDPGSGNMLLKVSLRGVSGDFAAPILIGSVGGIITLDIAALPTGGWMVVWTQIAQADVGNPFAAGTIMFSVSNADGSSWSAPAVVAALTDMPTDLRLVTTSTLVGLVYLHTADGPMATRYSLKAASWNGTMWSGPTSIFTDGTVSAFDAVGSGPVGTAPAVMAVSDASGNLNAFTWNGAVVAGPTLASTNAGNSIDLTVNVQQQFFLASALRDGGIGLLRFDTTNGWADLGTPFSNAVPSEVHITPVPDTDTTVYLITWPQGSPAAPIWYGFTDANGVPLKGPINLTPEATGVYSHLHALPKPGKEARIIARRDDGSVSIVQLDVAFAGIRPRLEQFSLLSGTGFAFTLTGDNSLDYRLQGAADLANWTTLTNVSGTNLPYFFLDPAALGLPHRFYRAVSP